MVEEAKTSLVEAKVFKYRKNPANTCFPSNLFIPELSVQLGPIRVTQLENHCEILEQYQHMCFKTKNLACFSTIVFFVCLFFIIYLPPPPSRSATDWTTIEHGR